MSTSTSSPGSGNVEVPGLSHVDHQGRARMVDVSAKALTQRAALARCTILTGADAVHVLGQPRDGMDIVETSRCAGIQAAKQTATLVPLCHPIRIDRVGVDVMIDAHSVEISAVAQITERTGVEMEALTACAVCALSLLQPLMEVDPQTTIENLALWHKSGGRSGTWERADEVQTLPGPP